MTIRYLKSMDEILREFPDYEFHGPGYLRLDNGRHVLTPRNFRCLGKQIDNEDGWHEDFIRPLAGEDLDD